MRRRGAPCLVPKDCTRDSRSRATPEPAQSRSVRMPQILLRFCDPREDAVLFPDLERASVLHHPLKELSTSGLVKTLPYGDRIAAVRMLTIIEPDAGREEGRRSEIRFHKKRLVLVELRRANELLFEWLAPDNLPAEQHVGWAWRMS